MDIGNLQAAILALKTKNEQEPIEPIDKTQFIVGQKRAYLVTEAARDNMDKVKAQIKSKRKALKWSQETLGKKTGLSQGTITRAERHGWISLYALLKISAALGEEMSINPFNQEQ